MPHHLDVREAVASERRDLVRVLEQLAPSDWDRPSLCEGWRIREVVAHITMPFRVSRGRFVWELLRSGGNFDRLSDRCARRDAAARSIDDLVASLRDNVDHPWTPPGMGPEAALSHDVIHGLDITVALGIDRTVPLDRLQVVLESQSPKQVGYFGVDLDGIELRADDLDWTYGAGEPLSGPAQDLLLVLCGRQLPATRLRGEPRARFVRR